MNPLSLFFLFMIIAIGGLFLEAGIAGFYHSRFRKGGGELKFSFKKYLFVISFPMFASATAFFLTENILIYVFATFAIVGAFIEWLVGWVFYRVTGEPFWTYHFYPLGRFTSYLSVPIWGFGGVLFWLLARLFV